MFHCPCVSQPHGPCGTCSTGGWRLFVLLWRNTERLTLHTNSEQMGSIIDFWWMQPWGSCLLCPLFCSMANYDGKAEQVRYLVSSVFFFLVFLLCASALARIMHCRFETSHPLGKIARCRYPFNLMHTPLGIIPVPRHHDITTKVARFQGSFSYDFVLL